MRFSCKVVYIRSVPLDEDVLWIATWCIETRKLTGNQTLEFLDVYHGVSRNQGREYLDKICTGYEVDYRVPRNHGSEKAQPASIGIEPITLYL